MSQILQHYLTKECCVQEFLYCLVRLKEPCARNFEEPTSSKILGILQTVLSTAVFKKVATFNIDFASRDGNRTHQNAIRTCDSNFVRKTIEIEQIKTSAAKSNARFFVLKSRWLCREFISSSISPKRCSPARNSTVFHSAGAINHMT